MKILGVIVGAVILVWAIVLLSSPSLQPQPPKAETQTRDDRQLLLMTSGAVTLKQNMRNPDSFKLESAFIVGSTEAVCYEYRSQNGFGGMNRGKAVLAGTKFETNETSGFVKLWNKECANKAGSERGDLVRRAMERLSR
jgi:hypothetical protein